MDEKPARESWSERFFARHAGRIVAGLTIVAAALRIYRLGSKSLWFDEAALWWIGDGSPGEILAKNISSNAAPPLFAFVVALVRLVGDGEWLLRAIPCLAGIAMVPAVYWLARRFLDRGPACFAALLVAVSPSAVYYSQQVREYTLAASLAAVMLALFAGARWKDDRRTWVTLTLTCCMSVFVHYGLALVILSLNLVAGCAALRVEGRKRFVSRWALSQGFVLAAVAAVMVLALVPQWQRKPPGEYSYIADAYWTGSLSSLWDLLCHSTFRLVGLVARRRRFIGALVILGLLECARDPRKRPALALALVPWALTVGLALARGFPYSGGRQNIYLLPMLCVVAASGFSLLARIDRRRIVAACIVAGVTVAGLYYSFRFLHASSKEDMRSIAATLAEIAEPGDAVFVNYDARYAFTYYYDGPGRVVIPAGRTTPQGAVREELREATAEPGRTWVVLSHVTQEYREAFLEEAGAMGDLEQVAKARQAWLYRAEPAAASPPSVPEGITASSVR